MLLWQPKGNVNKPVGELPGHASGVAQLLVADEQSQVAGRCRRGVGWTPQHAASPLLSKLVAQLNPGHALITLEYPQRKPSLLPSCCPVCQVITLAEDHTVRVWDLRNHKCVQTIGRTGEQQGAPASAQNKAAPEGRHGMAHTAGETRSRACLHCLLSAPWAHCKVPPARCACPACRLAAARGWQALCDGVRHLPAPPGLVGGHAWGWMPRGTPSSACCQQEIKPVGGWPLCLAGLLH